MSPESPTDTVSNADLFRFVVEDPKYNYLSARFPPDSALLAERTVVIVKEVTKFS